MREEQLKEKQRFDAHLRRLSERAYPAIEDGFDRELAKLRRVDEDVRSNLDEFYTASLGSSMAKNRFPEVKPNEGTIVRLSPTSSLGDGTYINANYVDAREKFRVPFVYIATQAPMKNTVLDFWRMVFENDCAFIVMLCAVKENGKGKSETYWPPRGETYDMGILSLTTMAENARHDSVHRRLLLRSIHGDEKEVYQLQYVTWPDQGVPQSSATLMEVIQAIAKSPRSTTAPIVVHCSGGVGRTGVFIGMHIALAQFQLGQANISIPRIVRFLKACRSGMVRRKDQYLFLYYAVQREMERMLLSEKTGVNLLDWRSHPVTTTAALPRSESATQATQMTSPLIMAMPPPGGAHSHFISSVIAPFRSGGSPVMAERRSASIQIATAHNADDDASAMKNYLQRTSPLTGFPRSPNIAAAALERLSSEASHSQLMVSQHESPTNLALSIPRAAEPLPRSLGSFPWQPPQPQQQVPQSQPYQIESPKSNAIPLPREADSQWRFPASQRSSTSQDSAILAPLRRPGSSLQDELLRQQQANRVKRFSPSLSFRANARQSSSAALTSDFGVPTPHASPISHGP